MNEPASTPAAQPPGALRRLFRNRTAVAAIGILAFVVLGALFVPLLFPYPKDQKLPPSSWRYAPEKVTPHSKQPPTWLQPVSVDGTSLGGGQFPFGTDLNGRDVFSRVIQGARISLLVGLCGALVSLFVGTTYGLVAGYVGGTTDNIMMRLVEVLHSIPRLIIIIVAIFVFDKHLTEFLNGWLPSLVGYSKVVILILCLGLIEWLSMARIVRGQVLALKEQQFILAARALGQSHIRILVRHLLPNLIGVVVVYLTLTIPAVILDESFLSFLGLGINDPQASWGSLLSDGKNVINPVKSYWWLLIFPATAMSLTLLALNFLGDAIRDALDPRAKR
jgi:peptide/nickel transport system permease protein/oligopeptide transport system permease protein